MPNYEKSVLAVPSLIVKLKRQEIPQSDERGINAVTKPAVWVQFSVKKNIVDDKKSSSFEVFNLPKNMVFFFCTYKDFRSQIVLSYP